MYCSGASGPAMVKAVAAVTDNGTHQAPGPTGRVDRKLLKPFILNRVSRKTMEPTNQLDAGLNK